MEKNRILNAANFVARLKSRPDFELGGELDKLVAQHGISLPLLTAVIEEKLIGKEEACRIWADTLGVAYVDPFATLLTDEAIAALPFEIARKAGVMGLYVLDGVLTAAMSRPDDTELVKRISQITQMPVSPAFALPRDIEDCVLIHYSNEKNLDENLAELGRTALFTQAEAGREQLSVMVESEPLARVLDELIHFALRERATDIHVEPQATQSRIRFRIDGRLREVLRFPRKLHRALVSRLKILSNLNISESRFPQDGRFSISIGTSVSNCRFSSIPTQFGEKAVVRLLASTGRRTMITLDRMMMSQTVLRPFQRLIQNPNGIIFVTGPTGSGKTTTLYAALHEINRPDLNISSIEDPIEIQLEGVTQSQINAHIDLKFSTLLRSLLRQDPDVLLIGEIRDSETAKVATEAALTGHLVFATLHTNSAAQAIVRLVEIGVEPYLVAPSVLGVLAQRLAARICENCKEAYSPSREVLRKYFEDEGLTDVTFYRGRGCPSCRGTGYKGRIAFHELILITEEIRSLISASASVQAITAAATKAGFRPLRYDGLKKVLLGLTTIEEVDANTSFEWAT